MNHDLTATLNSRLGEATSTVSARSRASAYTKQLTDVLRAAGSDLPPGQMLVGGAIRRATAVADRPAHQSRCSLQEQVAIPAATVPDRRHQLRGVVARSAQDQRWQLFPRVGASYVDEEPPGNAPVSALLDACACAPRTARRAASRRACTTVFANYIPATFAGKAGTDSQHPCGESGPEAGAAARDRGGPRRRRRCDDRAKLELTYYDQQTDRPRARTCRSRRAPASRSQRQNVGEVTNKGIEVGAQHAST